jgi:hypothetical protein
LPSEDDRPEPGKAELRIAADPGGEDFVTEDGWRIRYDELYASIGNVMLDRVEDGGGECDQYTSTPYLRVIDLLGEPSRLATLFARGPCTLRFELAGPHDFEIATEVDEAIVEAMRENASDPFVINESVALRVAGTAERASETVSFAWPFRQGFGFVPCAPAALTKGESEVIELRARLPALFADPSDGLTRFDPFAAADADGDGEITFGELDELDRPLGEHLYFNAVPQLFWIGDQPLCGIDRRGPPGEHHVPRP